MVRLPLPYLLAGILFLMISCQIPRDRDSTALAKAGDETLYLEELQSVLPDGISREDSILLAEDYIKKWIISALMVRKAEENLTPPQRDVDREMEEYRNSLIIYRYKKALMDEKLDTVVTDGEIAAFYENNKTSFTLSNPLMKAVFIKIPLEGSQPEKAKAYCGSSTPGEIQELQEYCLRNAETYHLYIDSWVDSRQILRELPDYTSDKEYSLEGGSVFEMRDSSYYYLICVMGFRNKGEAAPIEYIRNNIRDLIINSRKTGFLKKLEEDIYTEGVNNKKFRIYEPENK